jgi:hypothetical protein
MNNLLINTPERIDDDIDGFKLDCVDDEKNYTVSRIKLCRNIEDDKPLLFYTQDLTRNFRDREDPFGKKQIMKVFTPANHEAVADVTLTKKFEDTVLAHRNSIKDYNPLSDIHSSNMVLALDEMTAEFVSDIGININGLSEDFSEMESVEATPFLEDISVDATRLKEELQFLQGKLLVIKDQIADGFEDCVEPRKLSDDDFAMCLATENVPDGLVQRYLEVIEQLDRVKGQLGEVNTVVFRETSTKIKLPERIKEVNFDIFK